MLASPVTATHAWHDSFTFVTCLIYICDMFHSRAWHGSCPRTSRHQRYAREPRDCRTCVTCLIQIRDMTRSHAWHVSFRCVTSLIHMRGMAHAHVVTLPTRCSYPMTATRVWHYSFTLVTWLTHMRDMTHSHATWLTSTDITSPTACSWAPWLPHVPDMTHSHSCMYVQNIFWEFLWHPCPATQTHPWVCTDSWKRLNILAPAKLPRSNRTVKPLWFS